MRKSMARKVDRNGFLFVNFATSGYQVFATLAMKGRRYTL